MNSLLLFLLFLLLFLLPLSSPFTLLPTPTFIHVRVGKPTQSPLYGSWGPDPIWKPSREPTFTTLPPADHIRVTAPYDRVANYTTPGQYIQMKSGDKVSYLAIANSPQSATVSGELEFIVKKSESSEPLFSQDPTVEISQVLGEGFPISTIAGYGYDFPLATVVLLAIGTGIAPIKALIDADTLELSKVGNSGRRGILYYGVREEKDSLLEEAVVEEWEKKFNLDIRVCYSGNSGKRVTDVLRDECEDVFATPRNTGCVVCGTKELMESVKEVAKENGVLEGRVVSNF